jgi:hypothetical protein
VVEALDAAGDAEEFLFEHPFFAQDLTGVLLLCVLGLVSVFTDALSTEFTTFSAEFVGVTRSHCPAAATGFA